MHPGPQTPTRGPCGGASPRRCRSAAGRSHYPSWPRAFYPRSPPGSDGRPWHAFSTSAIEDLEPLSVLCRSESRRGSVTKPDVVHAVRSPARSSYRAVPSLCRHTLPSYRTRVSRACGFGRRPSSSRAAYRVLLPHRRHQLQSPHCCLSRKCNLTVCLALLPDRLGDDVRIRPTRRRSRLQHPVPRPFEMQFASGPRARDRRARRPAHAFDLGARLVTPEERVESRDLEYALPG